MSEPAIVVTAPTGVTCRIVLAWTSATNTVPKLSTAMPRGSAKLAATPTPSTGGLTPTFPAIVDTAPSTLILRIVLLNALKSPASVT